MVYPRVFTRRPSKPKEWGTSFKRQEVSQPDKCGGNLSAYLDKESGRSSNLRRYYQQIHSRNIMDLMYGGQRQESETPRHIMHKYCAQNLKQSSADMD